jgi:AcrR family transcriptional regulator
MAAEQRREQLLDAALGVIVEQGYAKVSIEAIARAAGVTRPVVYDHFSDLGALLHALIEREERYALGQLDHLLPSDPEHDHPAEVIAGSVRRFLDAVATRPATWTLILLPLEGTPELVRQHVRTNRANLLAQMEDVVRWAIERSEAADEVDVELAARAILGLAEDAGRMVLRDPAHYSPDRYERFVQWVMKLLWRR